MFAVDCYYYEAGTVYGHAEETQFFENLDEAKEAARAMEAEDRRVVIIETTGDPDDEGEVVWDC